MTRIIPPALYPPPFEVLNRVDGLVNGAMPDGLPARVLASGANHLLAQGRVCPGKAVADFYASDADLGLGVLWRTRYRSSPNGHHLIARVGALPSPSVAYGDTPRVQLDGGGYTETYRAPRSTSAATTTLADARPISGRGWSIGWTVVGDTVSEVTIATDDHVRVQDWTLYEEPRAYLDTAVDTYAAEAGFRPLGPITQGEVGSVLAAGRAVYEKCQKLLVGWCVDDLTAPLVSPVGAGYVNIFDAAVGAWTHTSWGWSLDVLNCASLTSTALPLAVSVYAASSGAGACNVRAVTSVDSAVANATAAGWYDLSVDADPTSAAEKLDIQFAGNGTDTCLVYAVAAWPYIA